MTSTINFESRRLPGKVAACRLDPLESQSVFKTMLDSFARPGSILAMNHAVVSRVPSALAPVLVLADVETRVHIVDTPSFVWEEALASATGARISRVEDADLIAIPQDASEQIGSIISLADPGSAFSPESAARIVIGTLDLRAHGAGDRGGVQLVLSGPGIDGERVLCVDGLTESDVELWNSMRTKFPAGVDVWFTTDDGRVAGVPRSTRVEIVASWPRRERI